MVASISRAAPVLLVLLVLTQPSISSTTAFKAAHAPLKAPDLGSSSHCTSMDSPSKCRPGRRQLLVLLTMLGVAAARAAAPAGPAVETPTKLQQQELELGSMADITAELPVEEIPLVQVPGCRLAKNPSSYNLPPGTDTVQCQPANQHHSTHTSQHLAGPAWPLHC